MNYEILYKLEVEAFGILERDYHKLKNDYNREKRILNVVIDSLEERLATQEAYIKHLEDALANRNQTQTYA
jgi:hypothetical protein